MEIIYQEEVIHKHIPSLKSKERMLIKDAIEQRLMVDPIRFGKPLRYSLKGHRILYVSKHCILYRLEATSIIVVAIRHSNNIYNHA